MQGVGASKYAIKALQKERTQQENSQTSNCENHVENLGGNMTFLFHVFI